MRDYGEFDKLEKLFSDFITGNKVTGIYKAMMPYIYSCIAIGDCVYIARYENDAQRAAASPSIEALKSLLANFDESGEILEMTIL